MRRPRRHVDDVRRYYERNTAWFARFGSDVGAASVHRALWPPDVHRLDDALRVSHRLVIDALPPIVGRALCVVDLGCGIGGALADLHAASSARLLGLTLSHAQARRAVRRLPIEVGIVEGSFLAAPFADACADLAYSIEAFAHAPDASAYFAEAARLLRPGARLLLIDDTLARAPSTAQERRLFESFVAGWHVPCVMPLDALISCAAEHGLAHVHTRDLTGWLRLRVLPAQLVAWTLHHTRALWRRDPVAAASAGSIALQSLLACGVVRYRSMMFERQDHSP
jgi:SAM-dependent methyltransferase